MKLLILLCLFSTNLYAQKITANWMGRLYQDHPDTALRDIIIPGTHDSATYKINKKSPFPEGAPGFFKIAPRTVANMSKTQKNDIYVQLLRGSRYLDLRVTDYKSKLYIVHGMLSVDLETVLKDIRKFSNLYPREIIIVDFQKMPKPKFHQELHLLIQKYLGEFIYFRKMAPNKLTFKHLWRRGRSLLPVMNSLDFPKKYHGYFNRSDFLRSDWANTTDENKLKTELKKRFLEIQNTKKLHVGYFTLTPNSKFIAKGIFAKRKYNIFRLNEKIFNSPGTWLPKWKKEGIKMNIVAVDFEGHSNLVGTILRLNKEDLVIKSNAK